MSNKAFDDMSPAEQKAHLLRQSEELDRQAKPAKRREVPDVSEKDLLALGGKGLTCRASLRCAAGRRQACGEQ